MTKGIIKALNNMTLTPNKLVVFAIFVLLLLAPIYTAIHIDNVFNVVYLIIGTLALLTFVVAIFLLLVKINKVFALIFSLSLLIFFLLVRLTLSLVYDFSGRGFSSEFFAHFGWQSIKVGFDDYSLIVSVTIIVMALVIMVLIKLLNKHNFLSFKGNLALLLLSLIILYFSASAIPEGMLLKAYYRYNEPIIVYDKVEVRARAIKVLEPFRGITRLPIEKSLLTASAPINPKNVIIIYLESFSEILTNSIEYPGLTPYIDKLKAENFYFKNNLSSAYVTIEGIANTHCGTLMNMENGNNSLTSSYGRLTNLPCLGDILSIAGYKQVFYGGADLAFAGKGAFLKEHGYDEMMGIKKWDKKGFNRKKTWGLTDKDLFDQALIKIKALEKEEQPFNFTLLTLGTHIPGFVYETCPKYNNTANPNSTDKFIQAIHCTDYLLGQFIQRLSAANITDNAIIHILGDHTVFPAPSMKKLFNQATDRRVLSLIVSPEKPGFDDETPTTSLNMVANILDVLQITHNTTFVLAKPDRPNAKKTAYFISRYEDNYNNKRVFNVERHKLCNSNNETGLIFPLDACEKQLAMQSIYNLGATYTSAYTKDKTICSKGIKSRVETNTNKIEIQWGLTNISNRFQHGGRPLKKIRKGLYLVSLGEKDNILSQIFYDATNVDELPKLKKALYRSSAASKFLLLTNLSVEELNKITQVQLPKSLLDNKIAYVKRVGAELVDLIAETKPKSQLNFIPESCTGEARQLKVLKTKHKKSPVEFCKIDKWFPRTITLGEKFNQQPSGKSAFWLKTKCAPEGSVYRFGGHRLETVINLPAITAEINDKELIKKAGEYPVELFHEQSGLSILVGNLIVLEE